MQRSRSAAMMSCRHARRVFGCRPRGHVINATHDAHTYRSISHCRSHASGLQRVTRWSSSSADYQRKDIVIIGGGITGASTSYFLAERLKDFPDTRITVVEPDATYRTAATALSASGIRQQFGVRENTALSRWSADFLRQAPDLLRVDGDSDEIQLNFREQGYLFLAQTLDGANVLRSNHSMQQAEGANVALMDPKQLKKRFPYMFTEDLSLGALGLSHEGFFDPYQLLMSFKRKASSLGVVYRDAAAVGLDVHDAVVKGVHIEDTASGHEQKDSKHTLPATHVINCSGAAASQVYRFLPIEQSDAPVGHPSFTGLPVFARKRCIFVVDVQGHSIDTKRMPLVVDPERAVYVRPEGHLFICGVSPLGTNDPDFYITDPKASEDALTVTDADYETLWEETIWPSLANRIPAFERAKVVNAWSGFYDYNTFDANVILGPHPTFRNFYLANGFSGHGAQQAPAIGRALSELIVDGRFTTLDLSRFGYERLLTNTPVVEPNVV